MSPSEVLVYNTQLALIEVLTQDLYFDQEALPTLPAPFNTFPRPRPDLINFFKNQKILVLSPFFNPLWKTKRKANKKKKALKG